METKDITQLFEGELMKRFERVLSIFFSCTLLLGLLPTVSFAAEGDSPYAGGTGTTDDPYQIATAEQLATLATKINGDGTENSSTDYSGTYFRLTADINLSTVCGTDLNDGAGASWTPIGSVEYPSENEDPTQPPKPLKHPFAGTFDGGGHIISGLYINAPDSNYQGLFGYLGTGGMIKNLGVDGTIAAARMYVGDVCGWNGGTITNCWSSCAVTGQYYVGGVCGLNKGGAISNCYNTGAVVCTDSSSGGGVCGLNQVGTIEKCYSIASVTGAFGPEGVCGDTMSSGTLADCYYNSDVATDTNVGVTGKTTAEFAQENTFTSWDFAEGTGVWKMDEILGRPVLRSVPEPYFAGAGTVNNPYLIPSLAALERLSQYVNAGNGAGEHFLLTADIDMSGTYNATTGKSWTPIGNESKRFKGTFDGGGHTISGLYINSSSGYQGLFGSLDLGGTIKNLGVDGSVSGSPVVGGVCGMNRGIITSCYNKGAVSSGNDNYAGGICGYNNSFASITSCYNTGSVISSGSVGGVCGVNANTVENCYYLDACGAAGDGTSKTAAEFASGEVAYLLQAAQSVPEGSDTAPQVWGQAIETDDYPVLTADPAKAIYKVTFNSDGAEYAVKYGNQTGLAALPNTPTKSGYTFSKWLMADGATVFTASTPLSADIEVRATWTQNVTPTPPEPVKPKVYKLAVEPSTLELDNVHSTATLTATLTEDGKPVDPPVVNWESSNETVATVDENGLVSAVAKGEATITATYTGTADAAPLSATCEVVVKAEEPPSEEPSDNPTVDQPSDEPGDQPSDEPSTDTPDKPTDPSDELGTDTPSGDEPSVEPDEPSVEPTEPTEPVEEPSDKPADEPGEPEDPSEDPGGEPGEPAVETLVIYRLYNPNSGEHFYTASEYERDCVKAAGWMYEGIGWTAPVKSNTPVYRLYSGTDHHYTTSVAERDMLIGVGWVLEGENGIAWYSADDTGTPLYRQFNPNVDPSAASNNSGSHNYTTNKAENDFLVSIGWQAEGVAWYGVKY